MLNIYQEILRKSVHLSSLTIALFFYLYGKKITLQILIPLTVSFIALDFFRTKSKRLGDIYNYLFNSITREKESNSLTGASYVFLSYSLVILFFNKSIAIPALLIMSICDSIAALIGKCYGTIKIKNKTLEGSIGFFFCSIIIILLSELHLIAAIISCFIATITELFAPKKINDNLLIPISFIASYLSLVKIFLLLNWST